MERLVLRARRKRRIKAVREPPVSTAERLRTVLGKRTNIEIAFSSSDVVDRVLDHLFKTGNDRDWVALAGTSRFWREQVRRHYQASGLVWPPRLLAPWWVSEIGRSLIKSATFMIGGVAIQHINIDDYEDAQRALYTWN
jgi:hypothetical protein